MSVDNIIYIRIGRVTVLDGHSKGTVVGCLHTLCYQKSEISRV